MKTKIFKSKFSDVSAEVHNGWAVLYIDGSATIALGNYPNARFEILEDLIKYMKEVKKQ